jgi:hypothetical protein
MDCMCVIVYSCFVKNSRVVKLKCMPALQGKVLLSSFFVV